nr:hypothetical protein [Moorella mulderi]
MAGKFSQANLQDAALVGSPGAFNIYYCRQGKGAAEFAPSPFLPVHHDCRQQLGVRFNFPFQLQNVSL